MRLGRVLAEHMLGPQDPTPQGGGGKFKVILSSKASSRPAWDRGPCLTNGVG